MSFISTILGGGSQGGADASKRKTIVAVVAILVIIGSVGWLVRTTIPSSSPTINTAPFIGLGEMMAEQTTKALSGHGRIVVFRQSEQFTSNVGIQRQWEAFQDRLKACGNLEIAAVETDFTLTREQLDTILKKYSTADAIVSFVGLPMDDLNKPYVPPGPAPKIIVYFKEPFPAKQFFANGFVTVMIRPRMSDDERSNVPPPQSPRDWFDMYFQVFDGSNYQTMQE